TILIIGLVYIGNKWLMNKVLELIAYTKNQELFFMSILLICLSVALLTSGLGMSLAIGAFLAGLMISESDYSQNAFSNLIPFKDTFTSFFFVSIGMLLDLGFIVDNFLLVLITVIAVILIKFIIAGGVAFILGHTFRGTVMVAFALCQVGEFSFILADMGLKYSILTEYYYQLFLATAIVTMALSPLLIQISRPVSEQLLQRFPIPEILKEGLFPLKQIEIPQMNKHIVFIGRDSRSIHLSKLAKFMNLQYISIMFDPAIVRKLQDRGESVLYGDALNEPILRKAHIETADIVVLSIGDLVTSMAITEKIRSLNKHAYLIVRCKKIEDIEQLYALGANQVIPEEFESALELFERVLSHLLIPQRDIAMTLASIRDDHYGVFRNTIHDKKFSILNEIPDLDIIALRVHEESEIVNKTLAEVQLRTRCGVTLVALKKDTILIDHPEPETVFNEGDIAYVLGKPNQLSDAFLLFSKS
ncbi:MAG: cation:proton antiporter, partial [Endomicrobiia bacterium]